MKNFKPFLSNHESFEIFKALIRKDSKLRQGDPIIIDWSESATFSEQSLSSVRVNVEMSEDLVLRRLPNIT